MVRFVCWLAWRWVLQWGQRTSATESRGEYRKLRNGNFSPHLQQLATCCSLALYLWADLKSIEAYSLISRIVGTDT